MNTPKAKETPTPRTDEAFFDAQRFVGSGYGQGGEDDLLTFEAVESDFARTLERELAEVRSIFPTICEAIGNGAGCSPDVTVEFLKQIPNEIHLVVERLSRELAEANKYYAEWYNECDTARNQRDDANRELAEVKENLSVTCRELVETTEKLSGTEEQNAGLQARVERLTDSLQAFVEVARVAHSHWDADQDSKVGKLLLAMSGHIQGYRADLDSAHAALAETSNPKSEI